jgi:hypothetical protein
MPAPQRPGVDVGRRDLGGVTAAPVAVTGELGGAEPLHTAFCGDRYERERAAVSLGEQLVPAAFAFRDRELVQHLIGHEAAICHSPGADVQLRDGPGIGRLRSTNPDACHRPREPAHRSGANGGLAAQTSLPSSA